MREQRDPDHKPTPAPAPLPPVRGRPGTAVATTPASGAAAAAALTRARAGAGPGGWTGTAAEARALQAELAPLVERRDRLGRVRRVAGLDVHYAPRTGLAWAAAVLLDARSLELLASALACAPLTFPYVPGLLSFREAPAALAALALLEPRPDLVLVDGQGLAHPRRLGLACHLGLLADLPTIGVAKSRLVGEHAPPPDEVGGRVALRDRGRTIGAVLRSRAGARPLYVSIGHRVSLAGAVRWTLRLGRGHRLPEPTRLADRLSRCHPG
jgi:deoxyribonuclease V